MQINQQMNRRRPPQVHSGTDLTAAIADNLAVVVHSRRGLPLFAAVAISLVAGLIALIWSGSATANHGTHMLFLADAPTDVATFEYNTLTEAAPVGPGTAATASIGVRDIEVALTDAGGVDAFAWSAVPVGVNWDIGGSWLFRAYIRTEIDGRLSIAARVYRISSAGIRTEVLYALDSTRYDTTGTYQLLQWTGNVPPGTILNTGERIGVAFFVTPDSDEPGQIAYLAMDNPAARSEIGAVALEQVVTPPTPTPTIPPASTPTPGPPAHNFNSPYSSDTSSCAGCHRVHTSPAPQALQDGWPEEQTCFACHDGTGGPDILSEFQRVSRMPVEATVGIHSLSEWRTQQSSAFSGANRHVECTDCHNPHYAAAGNHTIGSAFAFGPQQGVWGIETDYSLAPPLSPPTFTPVDRVTFQYELCLKCHSSWAYGASPPITPSGGFPQTDQSAEFNPANASYHPITAIGKNPFVQGGGTSYASSLINGLTPTSRLVCSDCHGSSSPTAPAGPHGSDNAFILTGPWSRNTGTSTPNDLCFTCHDYNVYANRANDRAPWDARTGFSEPDRNLHAIMVGGRNRANNDDPITCMDCHVAIPHGYDRDHLLGFTGDGLPYVDRPYTGGLTTIDTWQASGEWTFDSCGTAMDSCK